MDCMVTQIQIKSARHYLTKNLKLEKILTKNVKNIKGVIEKIQN